MALSHGTPSQPEPPRLLEQVREAIRVRHYSLRTWLADKTHQLKSMSYP